MEKISPERKILQPFQKVSGDQRLELWEDEADIGFQQKEIQKPYRKQKLVR